MQHQVCHNKQPPRTDHFRLVAWQHTHGLSIWLHTARLSLTSRKSALSGVAIVAVVHTACKFRYSSSSAKIATRHATHAVLSGEYVRGIASTALAPVLRLKFNGSTREVESPRDNYLKAFAWLITSSRCWLTPLADTPSLIATCTASSCSPSSPTSFRSGIILVVASLGTNDSIEGLRPLLAYADAVMPQPNRDIGMPTILVPAYCRVSGAHRPPSYCARQWPGPTA